jgi:NAD+ kinase
MALDKLIEGDYSIEDRMMIGGTVSYRDHILMTDIALNDIVIARRGRLRVVDFHIFVDDVFLCSYRADGIIVSTPTGSTGYSLSAGGPIVAPDASLILLTALAPHTLASRPVILPDNVAVTVELADSNVPEENTARVVFDGDTSLSLESGSRIRIMKTEQKTRLVKIKHTSFVEILREKLK